MGLSVFTDGYSCHWRRLLLLFNVTLELKRDARDPGCSGDDEGHFPDFRRERLVDTAPSVRAAREAAPSDAYCRVGPPDFWEEGTSTPGLPSWDPHIGSWRNPRSEAFVFGPARPASVGLAALPDCRPMHPPGRGDPTSTCSTASSTVLTRRLVCLWPPTSPLSTPRAFRPTAQVPISELDFVSLHPQTPRPL